MINVEKIGKIMSILVDNCDECPIEKVCHSERCHIEWKEFLSKKVKEDGLLKED